MSDKIGENSDVHKMPLKGQNKKPDIIHEFLQELISIQKRNIAIAIIADRCMRFNLPPEEIPDEIRQEIINCINKHR